MARVGGTTVFDTDPNAANIILLPDQVTVSKALVPVPDDMGVERRYVPCLNRLLPVSNLRSISYWPSRSRLARGMNTALCEPPRYAAPCFLKWAMWWHRRQSSNISSGSTFPMGRRKRPTISRCNGRK